MDESDFELDLDRVFFETGPGESRVDENLGQTSRGSANSVNIQDADSKSDVHVSAGATVGTSGSPYAEQELSAAPPRQSGLRSNLPPVKSVSEEEVNDELEKRKFPMGGERVQAPGGGRKFQLPSTLIAASVAKEAAGINRVSPNLASVGIPARGTRSSEGLDKRRGKTNTPELQLNKAHAVLADIQFDFAEDWGKQFRKALRWLGYISLVAALGYMVVVFVRGKQELSGGGLPPTAAEELASLGEKSGLARTALDRYLDAVSVGEKVPLIIDGAAVRPTMENYYKNGGGDPHVDRNNIQLLPAKRIGKDFWFTFIMKQKGSEIPVQIKLMDSPQGFLVDWMSYVNPGSLTWENFIKSKPNQPTEMRVLVKSQSVYGPPYTAADFECYELNHPTGKFVLYGYARRSERVAQSVKAACLKQPEGVSMNLFLKFDPDANPQQVVISEVAEDWSPLRK